MTSALVSSHWCCTPQAKPGTPDRQRIHPLAADSLSTCRTCAQLSVHLSNCCLKAGELLEIKIWGCFTNCSVPTGTVGAQEKMMHSPAAWVHLGQTPCQCWRCEENSASWLVSWSPSNSNQWTKPVNNSKKSNKNQIQIYNILSHNPQITPK